ncbi:hypothetical protein [Reyranella sp.]|uniref:hypothetical protein n=1 Tax=Reyranella sp. TaxID=1929291 RepID=UPI001212A7CA|nr:hypothetical protein [Reyranella sp.]TAJ89311.1 MAG: hypothetical protein EPO50_02760 [Reyranella sp.]
MSSDRVPVRSVRRADTSDAAAVERFAPGLWPATASSDCAVFVIDGDGDPVGAMRLRYANDRLEIERIAATSRDVARQLTAFAERTARALKIGELHLQPDAVSSDGAAALGFGNGIKRISNRWWLRALDHLEGVGVPLLRDGAAPLDQTLYYRGIWAAIALLVGFGIIPLTVFSPGDVTLLHVVVPAIVCITGTLFALWQIGLIVKAAQRGSRGLIALTIIAAAAVSVLAIGGLFYDRALPSLAELWEIYGGDEELGDLEVATSNDGTTLLVQGAYGVGSADLVRRALDSNPRVRRVVLAGPGGRIGPAFEINRMIRERKLATHVETGCASACTIAFLGGTDRSISPTGRLGFHQGSFPGLGANDMFESNRDMRRFLIASGVTPAFAKRAIDTPADEIWTPTPQELLAGKVVNRINR